MVSLLIRLTGRDKLVAEGLFQLKKTPGPGLCCVTGCRNKIKRCHASLQLCHRHYQQRWRKLNPKRAAYATLRDHAKARRIGFTLTFDRFQEITDAAGYWDQDAEGRGDRLSIDREDQTGPYSDTNVRVVTISENAAEFNRVRHLPATVQAILARRRGEVPRAAWQVDGPSEDSWLGETEEPF